MGAILGNVPSALGTNVGTRQFERREFESEHSHFYEIIRNQGPKSKVKRITYGSSSAGIIDTY